MKLWELYESLLSFYITQMCIFVLFLSKDLECMDPGAWTSQFHADVSFTSLNEGGTLTITCLPGYEFHDGSRIKTSTCSLISTSKTLVWDSMITSDCKGKQFVLIVGIASSNYNFLFICLLFGISYYLHL